MEDAWEVALLAWIEKLFLITSFHVSKKPCTQAIPQNSKNYVHSVTIVSVEDGGCTTDTVLSQLDYPKPQLSGDQWYIKPELQVFGMERTFPRNESPFSVIGLVLLSSGNSDLTIFADSLHFCNFCK